MFLEESNRLVTFGIADSRVHRSLCRVGRLVLRRLLGGIRLGCGRLSHNPSIPGPRVSELASDDCRSIW
jgi:hypothetical protein